MQQRLKSSTSSNTMTRVKIYLQWKKRSSRWCSFCGHARLLQFVSLAIANDDAISYHQTQLRPFYPARSIFSSVVPLLSLIAIVRCSLTTKRWRGRGQVWWLFCVRISPTLPTIRKWQTQELTNLSPQVPKSTNDHLFLSPSSLPSKSGKINVGAKTRSGWIRIRYGMDKRRNTELHSTEGLFGHQLERVSRFVSLSPIYNVQSCVK